MSKSFTSYQSSIFFIPEEKKTIRKEAKWRRVRRKSKHRRKGRGRGKKGKEEEEKEEKSEE